MATPIDDIKAYYDFCVEHERKPETVYVGEAYADIFKEFMDKFNIKDVDVIVVKSKGRP